MRAQLEALSEDEDDAELDASSTDTDEECLMRAGRYSCEASNETADAAKAGQDGQDGASSSRMSSGTLYNGSGSYEMSFHGNARFSGNIMGDTSRYSVCPGRPKVSYVVLLCIERGAVAGLLCGACLVDGSSALACIDMLRQFPVSCRVNSLDPNQLLHAHSSRSGEDLLFDLDEERHGHHGLMPPEPTTPSANLVSSGTSCTQAGPVGELSWGIRPQPSGLSQKIVLDGSLTMHLHVQNLTTAFRPLALPSMPSPGGCSSVGEAPSLSFSPLPLGTFAIDFPKEPEEAVRHNRLGHAITTPPPMARSLAAGHGGPPLWSPHAQEPLRRLVVQS